MCEKAIFSPVFKFQNIATPLSQYTVCIDVALFVVLRLKYGQNEDILRKKKASIVRFSEYYFLFRDTRTMPTNRKLFIIDQFPKGRYKPIWSSNNPDKMMTY